MKLKILYVFFFQQISDVHQINLVKPSISKMCNESWDITHWLICNPHVLGGGSKFESWKVFPSCLTCRALLINVLPPRGTNESRVSELRPASK